MQKLSIIIFLVLAMLKNQAQDYLITFTGTGVSVNVDSVQVKNLTQNTSLSLIGTDVLHLMGIVGIDQVVKPGNADLQIYPNPMNEQGFIEFETASSGIATIELFDIAGNQVAETQNMLPCGRHTFAAGGLSCGIYTLCIKSSGYAYSGKIVSTSTNPGIGKISYVSTNLKPSAQRKLKSTQSQVPMQYNEGDQLILKPFSGIYATVIPLVATQSQMVTVNFVACTDAGNNHYATVTIGTQVWMAENLNIGAKIPANQSQVNNGTIEKYCIDNDEANCTIYGGLYQWNEMMQYVTAAGVQGICPANWHIPTDGEWTILTTFLGGGSVPGGKMKSTGTIQAGTGLWQSPNTGATNESGFSAVPGGTCDSNGIFSIIGSFGYWWSSSENNANNAWYRFLFYNYNTVSRSSYIKNLGNSVRCVWNL
jgi:uncharacterized protein (TIGR02145 family)